MKKIFVIPLFFLVFACGKSEQTHRLHTRNIRDNNQVSYRTDTSSDSSSQEITEGLLNQSELRDRVDFIREQMSESEKEYAIDEQAHRFVAHHNRMNLRAGFSQDGLKMYRSSAVPELSHTSDWSVQLSIKNFGRKNLLTQLTTVDPVKNGTHQVMYSHAEMDEWYSTGSLGIEMGANIYNRPQGEGPLVLGIEVEGLVVRNEDNEISFVDTSGQKRVSFAELFVEDANGNFLPASMRANRNQIVIEVDDRNAIYPIIVDPLISTDELVLTAGSSVSENMQFGSSVAAGSQRVVVGAPMDTTDVGRAYVFVYDQNAGWVEEAILTPSDGAANDGFGKSVSINYDGDTIVVGSPRASTDGQAYVFEYSSSSGIWTESAILTPNTTGGANYSFGSSIIVTDDLIAVGVPTSIGSGYIQVYLRNMDGTWSTSGTNVTADNSGSGATESFGISVDIDEDTMIVGDPGDDSEKGCAYIFDWDGSAWQETQKLTSDDLEAGDILGMDVSLSYGYYETAVVSSVDAGVYIFTKESESSLWVFLQHLDEAAASVDAFGEFVLVGDQHDQASLYESSSAGVWTSQLTFDLDQYDLFASTETAIALPLSNMHIFAGFSGTDIRSKDDAGAVYVYEVSYTGYECTSASSCTSGYCVDGVCCDSACGGGIDDCQACSVVQGASEDGVCEVFTESECTDIFDMSMEEEDASMESDGAVEEDASVQSDGAVEEDASMIGDSSIEEESQASSSSCGRCHTSSYGLSSINYTITFFIIALMIIRTRQSRRLIQKC